MIKTHDSYDEFLDELKEYPEGSIESAIYKKSKMLPKEQGAHGHSLLVNLTEEVQVRTRWDTNCRQIINHSIALFHAGVIKLTQELFHVGVKLTRKHILESLNALQRRRIPAAPSIYLTDDWVGELRKFAIWDFYDEEGYVMKKVSPHKVRHVQVRTLNIIPDHWVNTSIRPVMGLERQIA